MKRRQLLVGLAGLSGVGAFTAGSGAFSNATAERAINVQITNDQNGVLTLRPLQGTERSRGGNVPEGTIEFEITEGDDEAINVDAILQYARDIDSGDADGLFRIENNGTETVEITDEPVSPNSDSPDVGIFSVGSNRGENGLKPLLRERPAKLEPGDGIDAGIEIDTFGLDAEQTYESEVTIRANTPGE